MQELHSLLKRQLKRYSGERDQRFDGETILLQAINDAYWQFDADREMLEHSMELTSQELLETNSALQKANQSLETRVAERALLDRVQSSLATEFDLSAILRTVVEAVSGTLGYSHVSLYLLEGEILVLQHQVGYEGVIGEIPISQGIAGRVARTGKPVLLKDVSSDPAFLASTETVNSEICVPLFNEGKVIGILNIEGAQPESLSESDLKLLVALSEYINPAIGRALLYTQLIESEEQLSSIYDTVADVIFNLEVEKDGRYRFVSVNKAFLATTGLIFDQVVGKRVDEVIPEPSLSKVLDQYREAIREKKIVRWEETSEYPTGRLTGEVSIAPVFDDAGTCTHLVGGVHDITERKQAETHIRQYADIVRNMQIGLYVFHLENREDDHSLRLVSANPAALLFSGTTAEEVIGRTLDEGFPDLRERQIPQKYATVVRTQEAMELEVIYYDDSQRIDTAFAVKAFPLPDNHVGVAFESIAERKQAENELRASEQRFRQLADNIQEVFWITDPISKKDLYLSPAYETVWGRALNRQMENSNLFLETVVSADMPAVMAALEKQAHGESTEMEYRITRPDGSVHWIWDRAFPVTDEAGRVTLVTGIAADITERKQAQNKLRESEVRYDRIASTIPGILYDYRLYPGGTNEFSYVSPRVRDILEIEADALMRDSNLFWNMIHPDDLSRYRLADETADNQFDIEVRVVTPSGRERWIQIASQHNPIRQGNAESWSGVMLDITERKHVQESLRESEERYRSLFENLVNGFALHEIVTDEHGRPVDYVFLEINPAFQTLTGIRAEQAIGRRVTEVLPGIENDPFIQMYGKVALTGEPVHLEEFSSPLNKYYEINAYSPARGQFAVTFADISERKLAEKEVARHLIELEALYENGLAISLLLELRAIGDRIIETFEKYLSWHHVTIRLRKGEGDELELAAFSVLHEAERQKAEVGRRFTTLISKVTQGISGWVVQTGLPVRTGNVRDYPQYVDAYPGIHSGMYMPLKIGERVIGCISVESELPDAFTAQDERLLATLTNQAAVAFENARLFQAAHQELTERMHAEVMLEQERNSLASRVEKRTAELSAVNTTLARALRVKDEFLANMSHELRTPLNAILGLSESLGEQIAGPLNEKQQKYVLTITESGHHLLALINDILDLAKIEAGQVTLDITKVDVHSVCESSLRMVRQQAQKKNQKVALEIDERYGLVWADERRLKQMIVNLLSNAVKFTPEGGRIGLEVHGDSDENRVLITVWDTGIGISEDDIFKLFQPFVQLSTGLARETSGSGLGLALVAQMARLHGGGVSVSSLPGEGSRFTLVLPWEPALALDTMERMKVTGKFRAVRSPGKQDRHTILLIEDTQELVMMVKDYLESAGYNVATAGDGLEGIAQARRIHPDLILMDLQMPRMDGIEATMKLRSEPDFKRTPIIALTALAMQGDRERCLAAGMDEYITKPVNLRALARIIESCLASHEEETGSQ